MTFPSSLSPAEQILAQLAQQAQTLATLRLQVESLKRMNELTKAAQEDPLPQSTIANQQQLKHSVTRRHVKNQPEFPEHFVGRRVSLENGDVLTYQDTNPQLGSILAFIHQTQGVRIQHLGVWGSEESGIVVNANYTEKPGEPLTLTFLVSKDDFSTPNREEVSLVARTFVSYKDTIIEHELTYLPLGNRQVPAHKIVVAL